MKKLGLLERRYLKDVEGTIILANTDVMPEEGENTPVTAYHLIQKNGKIIFAGFIGEYDFIEKGDKVKFRINKRESLFTHKYSVFHKDRKDHIIVFTNPDFYKIEAFEILEKKVKGKIINIGNVTELSSYKSK